VEKIPLSKAQQRLWLDWKAMPQSPTYNNPLLYRLCGDVDRFKMSQALQYVVDTQPALRCYFIEEQGIPKQILVSQLKVDLDYHDLVSNSTDDKDSAIQDIIHANVGEGFALDQLPLFRFTLIRIKENEYYLILNIHHIVVDGRSASLLVDTLSRHYNLEAMEASANDQVYQNYLDHLEPDRSKAKSFWVKNLANANFEVDLFNDVCQKSQSNAGMRQRFEVTAALTAQLKKIARDNKTTDFIVLMAAFYVVLAKYANQYDVTIGYAIDTRPSDCKKLFGFFVNNIPSRLVFSPEHTVIQLIQELTQARKLIKTNQELDYLDIIKSIRDANDVMPSSLFNISFIRANFALTGLNLLDIEVNPLPLYTGSVKEDICLFYDEDESFIFEIEYRQHKYQSDYIASIQESYLNCLKVIADNSSTKIADIRLFDTTSVPSDLKGHSFDSRNLISRFINHATNTPNKLALLTNQQTLTYEDLYNQVRKYVSYLTTLHLNNQQPVLVCLEREPTLVATILALMWLGIPYIPLEYDTPNERIAVIATESNASVMFSDLTSCGSLTTIDLATCIATNCDLPDPTNSTLAYIIYTSGSTGKPKGVSISYNALHNFLASMEVHFAKDPHDIWLTITTVAFDIAQLELLLPLWSGTAFYLANQKQYKDPFAINKILTQHPITVLQATPAMWSMLLDTGWQGKNNLVALCGGEALTATLAAKLLERTTALWNMYGPTEATIWCALKKIEDEQITVGCAIPNLQMLVLDEQMQLVPPYVKGDLYIAGIGLAEGYLNRADLTAEHFFYHPGLNLRLYRTGDVSCYNSAGEFIIYGRKDNQVKLNGYRIELGEIEANLIAINCVREAAVIIHEQQIVACLVVHEPILEDQLTIKLAAILPSYMLPKRYLFLDTLPLSNSGKIDRKALSYIYPKSVQQVVFPGNDLEEKLLAIWTAIMPSVTIGVTDNFFHCGGHSLLAAQIIATLHAQYEISLELSEFLKYPTIRGCATHLQQKNTEIKSIPKTDLTHYPLTTAQQQFWFLSALSKDIGQFNMAAIIEFKSSLDCNRLEQALEKLCQRHPILRTIILSVSDEPMQMCQPQLTLPLNYCNLLKGHIDAIDYLSNWARRIFNLEQNALWRVCVVKVNEEQFFLGLCLHHIIGDGFSVSLLLNDFIAIYTEQPLPPAAKISYLDYSVWENKQTIDHNKIVFWQQQLADYHYLQLPSQQRRTEIYAHIGKQYNWKMSATVWQQIRQFCQSLNVAVGDYCIGVFALFINKITNQQDFCIGMPVANRHHPEIMGIVGCFMNVLPLRMVIPSTLQFRDWLQELHGRIAHLVGTSNISLAKLLEHIAIDRNAHQSPLFSVAINVQVDPFVNKNLSITPVETSASKYEFSMDLNYSEDNLRGCCEYAATLFNDQMIVEWCGLYLGMLEDFLTVTTYSIVTPTCTSSLPTKVMDKKNLSTDTVLQEKIAKLWSRFLQVDEVKGRDNYFSLGGHSLLATKLIAAIRNDLSLNIPLELLFMHPVLEDFCVAVAALPTCESNLAVVSALPCLPLTPNQQQLAFLYEQNTELDSYHLGVLVECPNNYQVATLQAAINSAVNSHAIYRWQLTPDLKNAQFSNMELPLWLVIETRDHQQTLAEACKFAAQPFDLCQAPLVKFLIIQEAYAKTYLLVSMHHIIGDEWSLELLVQAILNNKRSISNYQWQDQLAYWQNDQSASLTYWANYIGDNTATKIPSTKSGQSLGATRLFKKSFPRSVGQQCRMLSERFGVSLYVLIISVSAILLKNFSQENIIAFTTAYDRRNRFESQGIHGYLVNLLPIVVDFTNFSTFEELLAALNSDHHSSIAHADVDFAHLQQKGLFGTPHIVFNFQHHYELESQAQSLHWEEITSAQAKFPLVLQLQCLTNGELECVIEYADSCYDEAFAAQLFSALDYLLKSLPLNLQQPLQQWQLVDLPVVITSKVIETTDSPSLSHDLQSRGELYADRLAIYYGEQILTYSQLWNKVKHLADILIQSYGDSLENKSIAVVLPNSDQYVITILAILAIGGIFVPIDINAPIGRQEQIIQDSQAVLTITEQFLAENILSHKDLINIPRLSMSGVAPSREQGGYIIYTSGSTGVPKGVFITQTQLHNFVDALQQKLCLTTQDKILQFASVSFDASIWEIFCSLYCGATLVIPTAKQRRVGATLQLFMQESAISHALLTPTVLQTLDPESFTALRVLATGGEACSASLVERWSDKTCFYNAYGPTEATICVAMAQMTTATRANIIGQPFGQSSLALVSDTLQFLPPGAIGELLIAGSNIMSGYFNQATLSETNFTNLLGKWWYKTGDYARLLPDNNFEYMGRKDRQVKIRGLRIELNEIEAVLQRHEEIIQATCQVFEDQLIAYVVSNHELDISVIRYYLANVLPGYMSPNHIVQIENLPLLASGKIDSKTLMQFLPQSQITVLPSNDIENSLYAIWKKHLLVDNFSIEQDFFALGGNSLQALQIIAEIEEFYRFDMPINLFYSNASVQTQAKLLEQIDFNKHKKLEDLINQMSLSNQEELLNL
jgi:amino acid adenylation domain-containing protein